jgi:tRNA(fMet)-specific endonuclease VapC
VSFLLDTNTVSFLMKGDASVRARLEGQARTDVLLCQPVVAEIEYGLARLPRSARRNRLRARFDLFLQELPRVEWTDVVSRAFGRIKADLERRGQRLEDLDVAVGAHALALGATLVTDNVEHMKRIGGLKVENWKSGGARGAP